MTNQMLVWVQNDKVAVSNVKRLRNGFSPFFERTIKLWRVEYNAKKKKILILKFKMVEGVEFYDSYG